MKKGLLIWGMLGVLLNTAFAVEQRQFTVKGFYNLPGVINMETKNTSFAGSAVVSAESDISISGGLGIGIEAVVTKIKENIEIIGGGSMMFQRRGTDFSGTWKGEQGGYEESGKTSLEGNIKNAKVDIKSIYAKARYLFTPEKPTSLYVAGKAAYNMVEVSWPGLEGIKYENGIGFGFSAGIIYENDFDIEFSIDNITGTAKHDFYYSDGHNIWKDSLKGDYSLTNMAVSVGYRF